MPGLSHGRPQWVRRVRRSSASSEGFVSLVTASALGPLGSTIPLGRYASPNPKLASSKPRVGPLAPVAPPTLQITAPDNDASAAAEPFLKTFTLGVHKLTTRFYSPRGNGGVEHVYNTMANILAMVCNEHQHNWDSHLSFWCTQTYDKRLLPD